MRLPTILAASLEANYPVGCTSACTYYPTLRAPDTRGLPTVKEMTAADRSAGDPIDWTSVAPVAVPAALSQYEVRYVIDRLCLATGEFSEASCEVTTSDTDEGGSSWLRKPGAEKRPVYRVSVRVTGPRSTQAFFQSTFAL